MEKINELVKSFKNSDEDMILCKNQIITLLQNGTGKLILDDSLNLFKLHEIIVNCKLSSLGVRMTVQFNLFMGTLSLMGTQNHKWIIEKIKNYQINDKENVLGCFALTERGAGVASGLIIETISEYNENNYFVVNTPNEDSEKIWISQGYTCRFIILYAKTFIKNKNVGIMGYLIDLENYKLKEYNNTKYYYKNDITDVNDTIIIKLMDNKWMMNGLDNTIIELRNVKINVENVLTGNKNINDIIDFKVNPDGFLKVAERLLSGRLCLVETCIKLIDDRIIEMDNFTKERKIKLKNREIKLNELSHVKNKIDDITLMMTLFKKFFNPLRDEYIKYLSNVEKYCINDDTQKNILISKAIIPDILLLIYYDMKKILASNCFLKKYNYDSSMDIMYAIKFAEGDDSMMLIKLALDEIRKFNKMNIFMKFIFILNKKYDYIKILFEIFYAYMTNDIDKFYMENTFRLHKLGRMICENRIYLIGSDQENRVLKKYINKL